MEGWPVVDRDQGLRIVPLAGVLKVCVSYRAPWGRAVESSREDEEKQPQGGDGFGGGGSGSGGTTLYVFH